MWIIGGEMVFDILSCGKNVDNFMLKNLTLTKCQGTH